MGEEVEILLTGETFVTLLLTVYRLGDLFGDLPGLDGCLSPDELLYLVPFFRIVSVSGFGAL